MDRACSCCTTSLCWLGWWESNPSSAVYQTAALVPLCYSPVVDQGGLEPPSAGCKPAALPLSYKPVWWTEPASNRRPPQCDCGALPAALSAQTGVPGWSRTILLRDVGAARPPLRYGYILALEVSVELTTFRIQGGCAADCATPSRMATWTGFEPALPCSTDRYVDRYTTRSCGIARRTRTHTPHVRSVLLFR